MSDEQTNKSNAILIADPEPFIRDTLKIKLMSLGYEIITAETGKEMTRKALNELPRLIITEIKFRDIDAYKACQALKGNPRTTGIPIVALSRQANNPERKFTYGPYIKEWLIKPFSPREVARAVREILSK